MIIENLLFLSFFEKFIFILILFMFLSIKSSKNIHIFILDSQKLFSMERQFIVSLKQIINRCHKWRWDGIVQYFAISKWFIIKRCTNRSDICRRIKHRFVLPIFHLIFWGQRLSVDFTFILQIAFHIISMFLSKFFAQHSLTSRYITFNISRTLKHQTSIQKPTETYP
jgi:hypothetical protein